MKKKLLFVLLSFFLVSCTSSRPSFTLDSYPIVDGSTVTIPLSEAICAALTEKTLEEVRPYIVHNKTHTAYLNLIDKKADLIFVTSPSADELKYASDHDVEMVVVPVVAEAFVFLTHASNPVDNLTMKQIQDIYTGKITHWNQVGGEDLEIIAYQRPVNSGSQTGFLELVMKGLTPMIAPTTQVIADMGGLIDVVATYDYRSTGIGYSYYYFVTDMWGNENVKLLKVDGVYPDETSITAKTYPINTAYYAVYRSDEKKNGDVRRIVDWLLSDQGQRLAKDAGYVKIR